MTFLVSGFATWRALGWIPGIVVTWMVSWMISWAIACPTMVVMKPIERGWLLRFVEER